MLAFPNIKINLGLSITEKRPDGYHNLETVFYPVALEDALEIRTSSETEKKITLHQYGMELLSYLRSFQSLLRFSQELSLMCSCFHKLQYFISKCYCAFI